MPDPRSSHLVAQLRSAEQILAHYEGGEPFPHYLRAFFRENKKFGSRDRRQVSDMCYAFFRLGNALHAAPIRERILAGYLLCATDPQPLMAASRPEWTDACTGTTDQKIAFLASYYPGFSTGDIFPLPEQLSAGIDRDAFLRSHFTQPELFLRLRPGRGKTVKAKLQAAGIRFRETGEFAIALDNATSLEAAGEADRDFVVQDLSSQGTADYFPDKKQLPPGALVWDACAGSGGKSIMASDILPGCRLFVSDLRPSILQNLATRFRSAGIRDFRSAVLDIPAMDNRKSQAPGFFPPAGFDLVIADVPCSGSGTWGRDPWAMSMFGMEDLEEYVARQRSIVGKLVPHVKAGSYLLYITCSVYAMENEGMVAFLEKQGGLRLLKSGLIQGYVQRADSMFAALFTSTRG
jgi:16S rRNA (cytosine967-C5)-methyltransferase